MEFVHGYLLGGLALIGVPVLVHLITREKPKKLVFPAFRFLRQNYLTNRRKLQLHHLLLLLLRILVIGFVCVALAQPWLTNESLLPFGRTQPVHAVFLIDTTPSMEYERGDISRLDDARRRAREVVDALPKGSQVCVLDTSSEDVEPLLRGRASRFVDKDEIEPLLRELKIHPGGGSTTRQLGQALTLLKEQEDKRGSEDVPKYVYIFSDRTRASWNKGDLAGATLPEDVVVVYIDVGTDKVVDVALDNVVAIPPAATPGETVIVRSTVHSIGGPAKTKVKAQLDGQPALERSVNLTENAKQDVAFQFQAASDEPGGRREGLGPGPHQVVLRLEGTDQLEFNNARFATFLVRPGRTVLTLMDEVPPTGDADWTWHNALEGLGYTSRVRAISELQNLKLEDYDMICLHQVTTLTDAAWQRLEKYVNQGKGLAIIPPGDVNGYTSAAAEKVLPAKLSSVITTPMDAGIGWKWDGSVKSALMEPFLKMRRERGDIDFQRPNGKPTVRRYWKVQPLEGSRVIIRYEDDDSLPALVERKVGSGNVLLFTTKLSPKRELIGQGRSAWSNYSGNSFILVLTDLVCRHLAGDSVNPDWNYQCGDPISIPLASLAENILFRLEGPGLPGKGSTLRALPPTDDEKAGKFERFLRIEKADLPGNYQLYLLDPRKETLFAAFSLNIRPAEGQMLPRVPKEEVEAVLGKDSVLDMEHGVALKDVVARKPKPLPLLPLLLGALVLFVAFETFVANRRRDAPPAEGKLPGAVPVEPRMSPERAALQVLLWSALGAIAGTLLGLLRDTSGEVAASIVTTTLLGLTHGLVGIARFSPRDSAILGGLLGSMVGVLYGWLVLGSLEDLDPSIAVVAGMALGAAVMAADGWFLGKRKS